MKTLLAIVAALLVALAWTLGHGAHRRQPPNAHATRVLVIHKSPRALAAPKLVRPVR